MGKRNRKVYINNLKIYIRKPEYFVILSVRILIPDNYIKDIIYVGGYKENILSNSDYFKENRKG